MKKILFTLILIALAGAAYADEAVYVKPFHQNKLILNPTTSDIVLPVDRAVRASTMLSAGMLCTGGTSAAAKLQKCDANGANCVDMMNAATCNADTYTAFTFTSTSIPAGYTLKAVFTGVTGATACTLDWERTW